MQLLAPALLAIAYFARVRTLRRRGTPVARWRQVMFATGLVLLAVSVAPPLEELAEEDFFFAHMLQHVLLGDLAPLALVLGVTGPILRPLLAVHAISRLRVLAHPLVALPIWAVSLYLWHVPALYEGALEWSALHAIEHIAFFTAGVLMWAAVIEVLPGPEWFGTGWKFGYVAVVRLLETVLGNLFVWSGTVIYGAYDDGSERFGIGPLQDQGLAGTIMMVEGSAVTIGALAWLFLRLAQEGELRQRLLESGHDPRAVRRAVRYGRGEELESVQ
ncbi:MAG: cytochrome c oxidase assembly protein [Actinomycetota bacterium]|nr:cytochrome c oxidase assembly protein [Actinomycetota bacterium]